MSSVRQLGVRFVQDRLQTLLCPENNGSGPSAEKKLRSCSPKAANRLVEDEVSPPRHFHCILKLFPLSQN